MKTLVVALLAIWPLFAAAPFAFADTPTDTIVVLVRDQTGAPLPFADVATVREDLVSHASADAQGRMSWSWPSSAGSLPYTFDRICATYPPGVSPTHTTCSGPVTVSPGETRTVTLVVDTSGSGGTAPPPAPASNRGWILGVVSLAGTKAPAANVGVQLAGTPLRTTTDAAGRYQFPALSTTAGANGGPTYTVRITPPPGYAVVGAADQAVTVQADHGVAADFVLQPLPCRFVLGFKALHDALPAIVGDCLEDERHAANGDGLQRTTHGLLVWRKADDFTAFTDGYRTWVNGPDGVQERLNSERFPWEANPDGLPVVR
jgi:hypothetical protein